MASNLNSSEAKILENDRVALENVQVQPEIAAAMGEVGYTTEVIAVGKEIWNNTRLVYENNKQEDDESSSAYAAFNNKRNELDGLFKIHWKKAKVVFRNDPVTAEKLAIATALPRTYVKKTECIRRFYNMINDDMQIQTKLSRLKVTLEEITLGATLLTELDHLRAEYLREKGESQNATKAKDTAFNRLDHWMSEFYAVAKIALDDQPQLLESLGKLVRN